MKRIFGIMLLLFALIGEAAMEAAVSVRGYFRKDGTYVAPHFRSAPDGNFYNNWSTKGNVNPYTGKPGTKSIPPYSSQPSYSAGSPILSLPRKETINSGSPHKLNIQESRSLAERKAFWRSKGYDVSAWDGSLYKDSRNMDRHFNEMGRLAERKTFWRSKGYDVSAWDGSLYKDSRNMDRHFNEMGRPGSTFEKRVPCPASRLRGF
jgi:hypothetical protein